MGAGIPSAGAAARRAEWLGLDSVFVGDHLFFHSPNVEAIVALSAAAGATTRIGLGTAVLLPALREPVVLAKQLTSLQAMSGGRLLLGVGVGGEFLPEWEAVGVDPAERGSRTDELLDFLAAAWSEQPVDHVGKHYEVRMPAMSPAGPMPPVWVGGRADAALRRVQRLGTGWLTVWTSARRMKEAVEAFGVRPGLLVFADFEGSNGRAFVEGHYAMPFENMERYVAAGPPAAVAESLAPFVELGVRDFVIFPMAPDPSAHYEDAAEVYELLGMR